MAGDSESDRTGRQYVYNVRGNRTSEVKTDGTTFTYAYADSQNQAWAPDQVVSVSDQPAPGEVWKRNYTYVYDGDGRATHKMKPDYHVGEPGTMFMYALEGHGSVDAVFGASRRLGGSLNLLQRGPTYNYFYDALGRRWSKVYPTSRADEFFYGEGNTLLEDRGNDSLDTSGTPSYPLDEYVWLGGRPIAFIRSVMDANWQRLPDTAAECKRNGEPMPCGVYYVVTDNLGKPIATFDRAQQLTGASLEEDPFGLPNHRDAKGDSAHPYTGDETATLASLALPTRGWVPSAMSSSLRVGFATVDTECGGTVAGPDYVSFEVDQIAWPERVAGFCGGWTSWNGMGPWVDMTGHASSSLQVKFTTNASNACWWYGPVYSVACGSCVCDPGVPCPKENSYTGISLESAEYRIKAASAAYAWPRLHFPGHYYDAESQLFENWHRYYDPSIGRYLQPEPLMQDPEYAMAEALKGFAVPAYAYASNNPLGFLDTTGLSKTEGVPGNDVAYRELVDAAKAGRDKVLEVAKKWENAAGEMSKQRWNKVKGWIKIARDGRILRGSVLIILNPCVARPHEPYCCDRSSIRSRCAVPGT